MGKWHLLEITIITYFIAGVVFGIISGLFGIEIEISENLGILLSIPFWLVFIYSIYQVVRKRLKKRKLDYLTKF